MAATMGVAMGFLAFLVIGGLTSLCAWAFYPGERNSRPNLRKWLMATLIGAVAALASSYVGQFAGVFQSGQMLEWLSAIAASCLAGVLCASIDK